MSTQDIFVAFVCIILAFAYYHVAYTRARPHLSPPPGPKGLPLIGNLLDLPTEDEYRVYSHWHELYGECLVCVLPRLYGYSSLYF